MSYSEENGQVVLRMSREDYRALMYALMNAAMPPNLQRIFALSDRLNSGNPNYTPYQVEAKKS